MRPGTRASKAALPHTLSLCLCLCFLCISFFHCSPTPGNEQQQQERATEANSAAEAQTGDPSERGGFEAPLPAESAPADAAPTDNPPSQDASPGQDTTPERGTPGEQNPPERRPPTEQAQDSQAPPREAPPREAQTTPETVRDTAQPPTTLYGKVHAGQYHLGPVDWEETQWSNACGPYPKSIQSLEGIYLGGVNNQWARDGSMCDVCVLVKTAKGKSLLVRLVTYGQSKLEDIDLSPAAYKFLHQGEYPRTMTWQLVKCAANGPIRYQYQTQANPWWTSLWVRNARIPLKSVEVQKANQGAFAALQRGPDGTWTAASGFGQGAFTLRITAIDGQVLTEAFSKFVAGSLVTGKANFR